MRSRFRRSGFSLLELMIVVVIIGGTVLAAGPALSAALNDQRAASATVDIVRLGRRARMEALASGRAQLLSFDAGGGLGRLRLFRGRNDGCNAQVWNATGPALDQVDMVDYSPSWSGGGHHAVVLSAPVAVDICYEPSGAMLLRAAGGGRFGWSLAGVTSGVLFHIDRDMGGQQGMTRQVVFPLGGTARVRR